MSGRKLDDVGAIADVSCGRLTRDLGHNVTDGHLAVGDEAIDDAVLIEDCLGDQHADDVGARRAGWRPALGENVEAVVNGKRQRHRSGLALGIAQ